MARSEPVRSASASPASSNRREEESWRGEGLLASSTLPSTLPLAGIACSPLQFPAPQLEDGAEGGKGRESPVSNSQLCHGRSRRRRRKAPSTTGKRRECRCSSLADLLRRALFTRNFGG